MKIVSKKLEENVIIAIGATKKIMQVFLGPFLTAYFIKTSTESISNLSIYYIFSYILLALSTFFAGSIIKNKFKIGMFRIGVVFNLFYIMTIIILKKNIVNHLFLLSIFYGISSGLYWLPYNLFMINKIDNQNRTRYMVKSKIITSLVGILCPILLGGIISVTNYELTAVIIFFISIIQIILSFILRPEQNLELPRYNLKHTWKKLKDNEQIKKSLLAEFLVGMNISDGALEVVMTLLIFNSFKTDMNLGIITSIVTIITMIVIRLYGRIYNHKDDRKLIMVASIVPVVSLLLVLLVRNNFTIIIYHFCYVIFTHLLVLAKDIRLFNLCNSSVVDQNHQIEFFSIRECFLNLGRVFGYLILLVAGIVGSILALNMVMIVLTLSILMMGFNVKRMNKFED